MAGIATKEGLVSLFGQMALNKDGYLFPNITGSLRDVEPVLAVRNRYPLVFASKTATFDGNLLSSRQKITKYVTVANTKKECHLNIGDDEMREGSPVLNDGMQDMVSESLSNWDEAAVVALEANATGYDAVAYFHATHNINAVDNALGTQGNLITTGSADVTTTTAPTATECGLILDAATDNLIGLKDIGGKLVNQGMKSVVVVVGTSAIATAFKKAIQALNGSISLSAQASLGLKIDVLIKTGITAGSIYIFRGDSPSKAVIMQESAPETRFTASDAKDSDNWFTYVSERGIGLGVYTNAVKVVLS